MAGNTWDTITDVVSEGWDITKNSAVGVATGVWDGLEDTVDGIVGTVKHPLQAAEALKTATIHPLKTIGAIKDSVVDSWNKEMINGDAKSRAHWIGNAATQVALSIFGTKGADKFAKTLKLSKMPKVPKILKAKRKGQLTKVFNAVHPKLQSVFNVLSPAYIRQIVTKSYDDMLKATKTEKRKTLDAIGNIGFKVYAVTPEGHKIPVKVTLKDLWLKITTNTIEGTSNRLIPGNQGIVTGGDSNKLGKNMMAEMGLKRSTRWSGYQAQHIIPSEMSKHPVIKKIGMDFDNASNGIFLRIPDYDISPMSRHRGYHSVYNEVVERALNRMDISQNIYRLEKQVYELQQKLRKLQEKGLPLYPSQGATVELWERKLNQLEN